MPRWFALVVLLICSTSSLAADAPDLILHNGKIATVDKKFSIAEAIAIRGNRITSVGKTEDVLKTKGAGTRVVDLQGKFVVPGLMDSHVHPSSASLHEFDHPIPEMESIADVLAYIRSRAEVVPVGNWITVRQIFITRLKEARYPTRAELDEIAPKHPVMFSTGPDGMLNSLALKESGIDKDFKVTGTGQIEKDPVTGELTGMLRSCTRYAKPKSAGKSASDEEKLARFRELFADYNSVGLTTVSDRSCGEGELNRYKKLLDDGQLTVRMMVSGAVDASGKTESVQERIRFWGKHPLRAKHDRLRVVGTKSFLDGGMLTGSAYMRQPWGVSEIYSIRDPEYRGVLFVEPDKLKALVQTAVEEKLQFTAHSVGDGAIHNLLDAYEEVNKTLPIRETRPCITHCNFLTKDAVDQMAKLGVVADIQPAWLYLDASVLTKQFGYDRVRYFQPLKSLFEKGAIAGGGSDHMQKIGSLRSINPYNPFLAIATTITRRARWYDGQLHPEEALSREQAIRFYTMNNAFLLFLEDEVGSLETGKQADLVILDRNLLTCPEADIAGTKVLQTYLAGKLVYDSK
ncbi:N-substituted formamide deformylase precursor [Anatilimnocola aggregata]|uniref:N-substituted formamide deformylase n=1 Tax=Anatilimnocola aggregata TaxID=2528021 RepID=A0A517YCQ4_9BACT|nr:amidohydrolase [Anatilimnocola aggregata]QDU28010.1 N-substituted formamide deformylase precursor [Anatilimnocola aggregata]